MGHPERKEGCLVAVSSAYGNALAALGTTARQYSSPGFGLHPRKESVRFCAVAAVRLKCALWHDSALLISLRKFVPEGKF